MIPTSVNEVLNLSSASRQEILGSWVRLVFGAADMDKTIRALRLLEEGIELAQAMRLPERRALKLVRHVYKRAPGKVDQEIGGVGCTLLALAESCGYDAERCTAIELARIGGKDSNEFRARNAEKEAAGFGHFEHINPLGIETEADSDDLISWAIEEATSNGEGRISARDLRHYLAQQGLAIVSLIAEHTDQPPEPELPHCEECHVVGGSHDTRCSQFITPF